MYVARQQQQQQLLFPDFIIYRLSLQITLSIANADEDSNAH